MNDARGNDWLADRARKVMIENGFEPDFSSAAIEQAMRIDGRIEAVKGEVERVSKRLGRTLTYVVGKPGLDGHSNGSEQIAARARQAGMKVVYEGIRFTPEEIVQQAIDSDAHVVGLSILSGSHLDLVKETVGILRAKGLDIPVVVGGIIPEADALALKQMGVSRVYTPKDYKITEIMGDVVKVVEETLVKAG